jgi:hypothetical protein
VTVAVASVSDKHRRTAELIAQDLRAQPSSGPSSLAAESLGDALSPLDDGQLVSQSCVNFVNQCNTSLTTFNAAQAEFLQFCISDYEVGNKCVKGNVDGIPDPACVADWKKKCTNASNQKKQNEEAAHKCSVDPQFDWCKKVAHSS